MVDVASATALMASELVIRPLRLSDLGDVTRIEYQAHRHPWKDSIHLSCIEQRYPSLVLELKHRIVAYVVMNYLYDEAHLMNITTTPELQGRGYASQLIRALYNNATIAGMTSVLLEVRESNIPAIHFYQKEGFSEIGRRPNYYPADKKREAAIVMQRRL